MRKQSNPVSPNDLEQLDFAKQIPLKVVVQAKKQLPQVVSYTYTLHCHAVAQAIPYALQAQKKKPSKA